jgi:heme a synthase
MDEIVEDTSSRNSAAGAAWRYRFALLLVGATFLLIVAGGNVTSKGAGLSVPDWPRSFGSVNPPGWFQDAVYGKWTPGVRAEHGHRLIGAAVGVLVLILAGWLWRSEPRAWVRRLGYAAVVGVIIQGIMGGLRVTEVSRNLAIVHGCIAQMFLCVTIALAVALAPGWPTLIVDAAPRPRDARLQAWTLLLLCTVLIQLVLGAILRQLGTPESAIWHIGGSIAIGVILVKASRPVFARPGSDGLARPMIAAFVLYVLQMVLGTTSYLLRLQMDGPVPRTLPQMYVRTVHMAVGAVILSVVFYLAMRSWAAAGRANPEPAGPAKEVLA